MKEYTYLNNRAVKRLKHNLEGLGFDEIANRINPEASGYLRQIFDPEDVLGTETRRLLEIDSEFNLLSEE